MSLIARRHVERKPANSQRSGASPSDKKANHAWMATATLGDLGTLRDACRFALSRRPNDPETAVLLLATVAALKARAQLGKS